MIQHAKTPSTGGTDKPGAFPASRPNGIGKSNVLSGAGTVAEWKDYLKPIRDHHDSPLLLSRRVRGAVYVNGACDTQHLCELAPFTFE